MRFAAVTGSRRRLLRLGGNVALAMLAGCRATVPATPQSPTREPTVVRAAPTVRTQPAVAANTRRVLWMAGADAWQRPYNEWVVQEWARLNSGVAVEPLWTVAQSIPQAALVRFATGETPPDAVVMGFENVPAFAEQGLAVPLAIGDVDQMPREQIDVLTREGKLYGAPWFVDVIGYFYNKALHRGAGLDPERPADTLDRLVESSARMTKAGTFGLTYSAKRDWGLPTAEFCCLLYALGGYLTTDAGPSGRPTLNAPEVVTALQHWADLRSTHKVVPPDVFNRDADENIAEMAAGKIGGWSIWHSALPDLLARKERTVDAADLGFAPTPYRNPDTGRTATWLGGWAAMVPASSRNRDGANAFVSFLGSPGPQRRMALDMVRCARADVFRDHAVLARWPLMETVWEMLPLGRIRPTTRHWFALNDIVMDAIRLALIGQATPRLALDDAQKKAEAIWSTGG